MKFANAFILLINLLLILDGGTNIGINTLDEEKPVIMVHVINRHGKQIVMNATYPADSLKNRIKKIWPEGKLQLTNEGKMDQYKLGQWLYKRYPSLLDTYSSETSYTVSTDNDITITSAMCLLAGIYPPKGKQIWKKDLLWQPIPVHAYSETAGNLLNSFDNVFCPRYWKEYKKTIKESKYIELWKNYKELKDIILKNTGYEIKSLYDVEYLYNFIENQLQMNMTIPEWASQIYPEPWHSLTKNYYTMPTFNEPLKRLFMGPLLKEITDQFKAKISGKTEMKLLLYSGHDENISNLLNLLKVYDGTIPPYSSALMIELRKDKDNHYFVTMFYKNSTQEPHLLEIPGCQSVCTLDEFNKILSPYIPTDWNHECSLKTSSATISKGVLMHCLVALMFIFGYQLF